MALCNVDNFSPSKWLTLGRTQINDLPHCPLVGEYSGTLPDAEGLCAKSYADCNNPEVMFYTVFNCNNQSEVYEEREYRCFGQWQEDGLVYTYTERRDIPGNECFVGVTIDDDRNIVTEAGQNCERGHQPEKYGMTLHRQAKCSYEMNVDTTKHDETIEQVEAEEEQRLLEILRSEEDERAVSPRLGNVHNTMSSNVDAVPIGVADDRHRRKHHKKHHRVPTNTYSDILSNEIPGSASPSASGAAQTPGRTFEAMIMAIVTSLVCRRLVLS